MKPEEFYGKRYKAGVVYKSEARIRRAKFKQQWLPVIFIALFIVFVVWFVSVAIK